MFKIIVACFKNGMDGIIAKTAKTQLTISSSVIEEGLKSPVSTITIRRRPCEAKISARSSRTVQLLKKKRLQSTKVHIGWPKEKLSNMLWTDESKIVLFGSGGHRQFVR